MISRSILKYNLNGSYKLVQVPLRFKSSYSYHGFTDNSKKLSNSLSRAKNKLLDYLQNNDFKYFVTLTFNSSYNSYDLDYIRKIVTQKIRDMRKLYNFELRYVLIPERHKKGDYHLHGFLSSEFDVALYLNEYKYLSLKYLDNFGQVNVQVIRNYDACSKYALKYVTKDLLDITKGKHVYFCSQHLKTRRILLDIANTTLKEDFFDYNNDYCSVLDFPETDFNNVYKVLNEHFLNYYNYITE